MLRCSCVFLGEMCAQEPVLRNPPPLLIFTHHCHEAETWDPLLWSPKHQRSTKRHKQNLNTQTCTICGRRKVCWQIDFSHFYLVVMSRGATGNRMVSVAEHLLSDINICHVRLAPIKPYRLIPFYVSSNRTTSRLSSPNPSQYYEQNALPQAHPHTRAPVCKNETTWGNRCRSKVWRSKCYSRKTKHIC